MNSFIKKVLQKFRRSFSAIEYWESRYRSGGNSGSGSYHRLAEFKAKIINEFLSTHPVQSTIEFGCGDGNQLSLIHYPRYIGLDVARTSINICTEKFKKDPEKRFFLYDPFSFTDQENIFKSDLSLSLDVIFHLVEDEVYELYMTHLFNAALHYVIIYSSDYENVQVNHERRRKFTEWIKRNKPGWKLIETKENPFRHEEDPDKQSLSDFYIYQSV